MNTRTIIGAVGVLLLMAAIPPSVAANAKNREIFWREP